MKSRSICHAALGICLTLVPMAHVLLAGQIVYVDDDAPAGGDGTSWQAAYRYLQDSLQSASLRSSAGPFDIHLAQGVYKPDQSESTPEGSGDRDTPFVLPDNTSLLGGFAGILAEEPNYRDVVVHVTVLSGDLVGNDAQVTNPRAMADDATRFDNSRHVVVVTGPTRLEGVTVTGGHAAYEIDSTADNPHAGAGGGLLVTAKGAAVRDCVFRDNFAADRGGAMHSEHANMLLARCTFASNSAYTDSAFAQGHGGAVSCIDSEHVELMNCLFTGNVAGVGGALFSEGGMLKLANCTAVGNWAVEGSLLADDTPRPARGSQWPWITMDSCIVADGGSEISNGYSSLTIDYTNLQGGTSAVTDPRRMVVWGSGNLDVDPCFADPGYWHSTETPDYPNDDYFVPGDYHLRSRAGRWDVTAREWVQDVETSPCVDAGNPATPFEQELSPNGIRVNMGAYGGTVEASQSDYSWWLMTTEGPLLAEEIGVILPHEHIFTDLRGPASPGYGQADPADVVRVMKPLLAEARVKGVGAMFECSSIGVGRNPSIVAQVARESGLAVVLPTGVYGRDNFAPPEHRSMTEDELTELIVREIREGIEGTGIRAGFIKIATGGGPMTALEERFLRAAGRAASETGAAVASHTTFANNATRQVAILESIDPAIRFIWVHAQSQNDPELHQQMASRGAFIELDSLGWNPGQDSALISAVQELLAAGYGDRILLSHDAGWYQPGSPNGGTQKPYTYLIDTFLDELRNNGVGQPIIRMITESNPVRAFGLKSHELSLTKNALDHEEVVP